MLIELCPDEYKKFRFHKPCSTPSVVFVLQTGGSPGGSGMSAQQLFSLHSAMGGAGVPPPNITVPGSSSSAPSWVLGALQSERADKNQQLQPAPTLEPR